MTDDGQPAAPPMPAALRARVVAMAAEALGTVPPADVPAPLRSVARFVPTKRARAGGAALAAALENDPVFRQHVAAWARSRHEVLAAAVELSAPPPAADPVEVAALAYLLRPVDWGELVRRAVGALDDDSRLAERAESEQALARLSVQLEESRTSARLDNDRARIREDALRVELAEARRRVRELEAETGRLRRTATTAEQAATDVTESARRAEATAATETRRLRARLAEAEAAVEATRKAGREGRSADDLRLRLLLDTVLEAAQGLRRELALPPVGSARPADAVTAVAATVAGVGDVPVRAHAIDDPAVLDQLLALPQVHLVVDGYNVTKSGYGTLSLAEQRQRLLTGLAVLGGQTGAEVTCVFDGAEVGGVLLQAAPRGVRVLFSPPGETADEVIRRLVRAEPPGRPIVVVSSDREVADSVARSGARPLPSSLLLRRLERA